MSSNTPALIIVGYTAVPVSDVWQYFDEPTPPSGHKNEEAIEKWRQKTGEPKKQKLLATAPFCKITGRIHEIFAVDPAKRQIFDSRKLKKTNPSLGFVKWLLGNYPEAFPVYARSTDRRGVVIVGFGSKEFVRVVWTECSKLKYRIPNGFGYMNEDCLNPYHMLVEADRRKELTLTNLLRGEGLTTLPQYAPHADPKEDARLAAELVHSRFLYQDDIAESHLRKIIDERLHAPVLPEPVEAAAESVEAAAEDELPSKAEDAVVDAGEEEDSENVEEYEDYIEDEEEYDEDEDEDEEEEEEGEEEEEDDEGEDEDEDSEEDGVEYDDEEDGEEEPVRTPPAPTRAAAKGRTPIKKGARRVRPPKG